MNRFFEKSEIVANVVAAVAVGTFLVYEIGMSGWRAEMFPILAGVLTSLLFLERIFSAIFIRREVESLKEEGSEKLHRRMALGIVLSGVGLYVLIALVGFAFSILVYLAAMPFALGYRRRVSTIVIALTVYLVLMLLAKYGLLFLPKGIFFGN